MRLGRGNGGACAHRVPPRPARDGAPVSACPPAAAPGRPFASFLPSFARGRPACPWGRSPSWKRSVLPARGPCPEAPDRPPPARPGQARREPREVAGGGRPARPEAAALEHYRRARVAERPVPLPPPFARLPPGLLEVRVRDGSKLRNLLRLAVGRLEAEAARQVLFRGAGRAVGKTVACVEILKRRLGGLHQLTGLFFAQAEEVWEPRAPEAGLDPLTVRRSTPAICVLLSKDPLDARQPGYQAPGAAGALWTEAAGPALPGRVAAGGRRRQQGGRAGKNQPRALGGRESCQQPG